MIRKEIFETGRPYFFLTLKNKLYVNAQQIMTHEILKSLDLYHCLPLVVVGPAPPHGSVMHNRLKGSRRPRCKRFGRHHVIVAVNKNRGDIRRDVPFAIHNRVALGGHHLDALSPGLAQQLCPTFGTPQHIVTMFCLRADTRNAQKAEPLGQEARFIFVDIRLYITHFVVG